MNTCDTTVWVHGVLRCAKVQYRTHTRGTCFGSTVGKPVPMRNPKCLHHQHPQLHLVAPPKMLILPYSTRNESGHTLTSSKSFSSYRKRTLTLVILFGGGRAAIRNSQTYPTLLVISSPYRVSISFTFTYQNLH